MDTPFEFEAPVEVHALCLGDRIDLRGVPGEILGRSPFVVRAGSRGCAVVFRYGCVVLVNLSAPERAAFLSQIGPLVTDPLETSEHEALVVERATVSEGRVEDGRLFLSDIDVPRIQLIAHALAKSVALNHYESLIETAFNEVEPLARRLKTTGRSGERARQLVSKIGSVLLLEHDLVGRVEVVEQPELLWEEPQLEGLYAKLQDEYELTERSGALDRKLRLLMETAGVFIDLLHNKRSLRVEWYIVVLIVVEIGIMIYEMIWHP